MLGNKAEDDLYRLECLPSLSTTILSLSTVNQLKQYRSMGHMSMSNLYHVLAHGIIDGLLKSKDVTLLTPCECCESARA